MVAVRLSFMRRAKKFDGTDWVWHISLWLLRGCIIISVTPSLLLHKGLGGVRLIDQMRLNSRGIILQFFMDNFSALKMYHRALKCDRPGFYRLPASCH